MDQQLKEFLEGLKESDIQGTKTYTKIKWFARVFLERKNRPYEEYETFASSWGVLRCTSYSTMLFIR